MTTVSVTAVYTGTGALNMEIPAHPGFMIDLLKKIPLRCLTFTGFSLAEPQMTVTVRNGYLADAEEVFRRHFPWVHVVGAVLP
jgi:hypothetical protein